MPGKCHDRRSLRLPNYDYASDGAYFMTICIEGRRCLMGNVHDGRMHSNHIGEMVQAVWDGLPRYHGVGVDAFVIMPNHVHGIIIIDQKNVGATPCGCPDTGHTQDIGQARGPAPTVLFSLGDVVHRFKSLTTTRYRQMTHNPDDGFSGKLWQRNYYERIIRNEKELSCAREYIINNPGNWADDENNKVQVAREIELK